jgi:hypothetical protein
MKYRTYICKTNNKQQRNYERSNQNREDHARPNIDGVQESV